MSTESCTSTANCGFNYECDTATQLCVHLGIWPPNTIDIIIYAIMPIVIGIGSVGGLGGGIVKVPLLILVLNYPAKQATFLAYCLLFGSCVSNGFQLLFKRHPTIDRPRIDYGITLIINPMVLLGTNIGIYLNLLLPEVVNGGMFIVFLSIVSPYLFNKARKLRENRKTAMILKGEDISMFDIRDSQRLSYDGQLSKTTVSSFVSKVSLDDSIDDVDNQPSDLREFLRNDSAMVPMNKFILLLIVFVSVQMCVFLRGGKGLKSFIGLTTCSIGYWIVCGAILVVALVSLLVIRIYTKKWQREKQDIVTKYGLEEKYKGDLDLSDRGAFYRIAGAGLLSGILAGTFGVGAGLAVVPILLAEGLNSEVVTATSGFNYVFISLTTIINVFTNGSLTIEQIGWFALLSFIGGSVCAKFIYYLVEKSGQQYIVIFFVCGLSVLNVVAEAVFLTEQGIDYGSSALTAVSSICNQ